MSWPSRKTCLLQTAAGRRETRQKAMIKKINIRLTQPTGEILRAGELAVKDPDGRGGLQGQFRYAQEYLARPKAFPLDR